jgi:oligopeptide transport system permease protein
MGADRHHHGTVNAAGSAESLEPPPPRRAFSDHPLSNLLSFSFVALALSALILAPIAGLEWIPRWGSWAWVPRWTAVFWLLANLVAAAAILAWRGRSPGGGEAVRRVKTRWREASLFRSGLRRLRQNRMAMVSAALLAVIVTLCLVQRIWSSAREIGDGTIALHLDHQMVRKGAEFRAPDIDHWFGTDALGRDLFARVLRGGMVSFTVGLVATLVSLVIGVTWGAVAGYLGGRVDLILMRIVDVLYGLPFIFLVILILTLINGLHRSAGEIGPVLARMEALEAAGDTDGARRLAAERDLGLTFSARAAVFLDRHVDPLVAMFAALGLVQWLTMARITRGQVLALKEREFVTALRVSGARAPRIIFRHIVPNLLGPVIVDATLTIPAVMLSEAFLSFLGLGIAEPEASWGSLAARGLAGVNLVKPAWWLIAYPAGAISLTLFCLNFLGDGLRDALDPRARRGR